eukprot:gb/GECG01003891.1/.p1 GENE.gb/GECG01003891.1/~~gb/GECG01003891.1/.p1  ORF type:complete len:478 (+),score=42.83 gb/GECG01003891.1/:1-1434(+)
MSTFGTLLRVTTFGESHGSAVGCVIDNFPPRFPLDVDAIQAQLTRRRPGQSVITTTRDEQDNVQLMSGMERGLTLGTPIAMMVYNKDMKPGDYQSMASTPRPGHADYTYHHKYGIHAASGGGRSSARETIGRVAAGAAIEQWLQRDYGIRIVSCVCQVGHVKVPPEITEYWKRGKLHPTSEEGPVDDKELPELDRSVIDRYGTLQIVISTAKIHGDTAKLPNGIPAYVDHFGNLYTHGGEYVGRSSQTATSMPDDVERTVQGLDGVEVTYKLSGKLLELRCPHTPSACAMATAIRSTKTRRDSIGGILLGVATNVPVGVGEPCFDKIEATLAHAMMSLPATKGFEIGSGFEGVAMRGSRHNDRFVSRNEEHTRKFETLSNSTKTIFGSTSNNSGGTLGGISSGMPLYFRVAIKPVSSIGIPQQTTGWNGEETTLEAKGRHDPCVLPRAPPLVEAMTALVLGDSVLCQKAHLVTPTDS